MQPSRDAFHALAADHTVVPVWREILADQITPVAGFARLVGDGPGFLFESVTANGGGAGASSGATRAPRLSRARA